MNKRYLFLIVIISILIIPSVYGIKGIIPYDEFCKIKTNDIKTTAADFICQVDIIQMKADLDRIKLFVDTKERLVVINEFDINPPGDDSKYISEWVELYNPTDSEINISGWEIASATVLKKTLTLPEGTIIKPEEFLTYTYQTNWFTDTSEILELRTHEGIIIDRTPILTDSANDFNSWQRIYDGLDTDSSSDWKFVTSTAGSSNGKES